MVNGDKDRVVPSASVGELAVKLKTQRGIKIDHEIIPGANHFFEGKTDELQAAVGTYLDMRLAKAAQERESKKEKDREREKEREKEREREAEEE
jgi:dienelactone hydrolase